VRGKPWRRNIQRERRLVKESGRGADVETLDVKSLAGKKVAGLQKYSSEQALWQRQLAKGLSKMSAEEVNGGARGPGEAEATQAQQGQDASKAEDGGAQTGKRKYPKHMFAILFAYNGSKYRGLQINPGVPTIEEALARVR